MLILPDLGDNDHGEFSFVTFSKNICFTLECTFVSNKIVIGLKKIRISYEKIISNSLGKYMFWQVFL